MSVSFYSHINGNVKFLTAIQAKRELYEQNVLVFVLLLRLLSILDSRSIIRLEMALCNMKCEHPKDFGEINGIV